MGREIRKVPPKWEHPKHKNHWSGAEEYNPMHDLRFEEAAAEWRNGFLEWETKGRADYLAKKGVDLEFWVYSGAPPDPKYYRPWADEEATWFQVWETVSEGTPVSPPFATIEELASYLAANGDFGDQERGSRGWGKEAAERFCKNRWAPSLVDFGHGIIEGKLA